MQAHRWIGWSERGFSLAEAVVALGVIASGVLTMAAVAAGATDTVRRARHRTVASHLADMALTELATRAVPPAGAACLTSDTPGCVEFRAADGTVVDDPAAPYSVRWSARTLTGTPVPAALLSVCTVTASERTPAARPIGACLTRIVMEPWP